MIRKEDFTRLRNEIKEASDEAFEYAQRTEKNENDFYRDLITTQKWIRTNLILAK